MIRGFAKATLPVIITVTLFIFGTPAVSMTGALPPVPTVPEIDAATGITALALSAGAILIIRGRRKK